MKKNILIIGLVYTIIISCSKNENSNDSLCVNPKTISLANVGQEFNYYGLKQVFSNSNFEIYVSKYSTPNGDLIRDSFGIYILRINDGAAFSNYPFLDVDNVESNPNLGFNPTGFFSEGSIKISNKCVEVFSTQNINTLYWIPTFNPRQVEGSYSVELKLKLDDNTEVNVNTTTEVINY